MTKAAKYLLLSLVSFNFFVAICFVLRPDAFALNTALSYYGTNATTIVPYSLGVLSAMFFLLKSAASLKGKRAMPVRLAMQITAWAFLASLLLPYSISTTFWVAHGVTALTFFTAMLFASIYVLIKTDHRPLNLLLFALQIVGMLLVWFSVGPVIIVHLTAFGELLIDWAFVALMYNTLSDISEHHETTVVKS